MISPGGVTACGYAVFPLGKLLIHFRVVHFTTPISQNIRPQPFSSMISWLMDTRVIACGAHVSDAGDERNSPHAVSAHLVTLLRSCNQTSVSLSGKFTCIMCYK